MKHTLISMRTFYILCALSGFTVTMYFNILFVIDHQGFSPLVFVFENYVNHASSSIMNDIWVILVTFIIWSYKEAKRLSMPYWWMYALGSVCIALAFTLPLFLYFREIYIQKTGMAF